MTARDLLQRMARREALTAALPHTTRDLAAVTLPQIGTHPVEQALFENLLRVGLITDDGPSPRFGRRAYDLTGDGRRFLATPPLPPARPGRAKYPPGEMPDGYRLCGLCPRPVPVTGSPICRHCIALCRRTIALATHARAALRSLRTAGGGDDA